MLGDSELYGRIQGVHIIIHRCVGVRIILVIMYVLASSLIPWGGILVRMVHVSCGMVGMAGVVS